MKTLLTSIRAEGGSQDLKDLSAQEQSLLAGSHWGSLGTKVVIGGKMQRKLTALGKGHRNNRKRNVLTLHCLKRRELQRAENTTILVKAKMYLPKKDVLTFGTCINSPSKQRQRSPYLVVELLCSFYALEDQRLPQRLLV